MTRKFFTLEPSEEFLGVIRPSLWTLAPRALSALVLIAFPFAFWPALLRLGTVVGAAFGVAALCVGVATLRDLRRRYLENGVYLTSLRAIDVFARRRSVRVTQLLWSDIEAITATKKGPTGMIGYGSLLIKGTEVQGYSLFVGPIWKPDLVRTSLPRV
jgi:hypothetical protein